MLAPPQSLHWVMLADGSAPSVLAFAPLAVVLALRKGAEAASGGGGTGLWREGLVASMVEGAAGALGAADGGGRSADGLAARGAGKGAVEQHGAAGGWPRRLRHSFLRLTLIDCGCDTSGFEISNLKSG